MILKVLGALGALAVIAFIFWWNTKGAKTRRAMRKASLVPVRDAPEGTPVKLIGRVKRVVELLESPFSQQPCAFWQIRVREHRATEWATVIADWSSQPFVIEDESGSARIEGVELAELDVTWDSTFQSNRVAPVPPHVAAFLAKSDATFGLGTGMIFDEGVLREGDTVAIIGILRREADPEAAAAYRDPSARAVVHTVLHISNAASVTRRS